MFIKKLLFKKKKKKACAIVETLCLAGRNFHIATSNKQKKLRRDRHCMYMKCCLEDFCVIFILMQSK